MQSTYLLWYLILWHRLLIHIIPRGATQYNLHAAAASTLSPGVHHISCIQLHALCAAQMTVTCAAACFHKLQLTAILQEVIAGREECITGAAQRDTLCVQGAAQRHPAALHRRPR